jgi:hypothetical protein
MPASSSLCHHTKLHHCALITAHESPWAKLYHCGYASSFITMTGLSRQAFTLLDDVLFLGQQPQRTGKNQQLHSTCFILVLPWETNICV